MTTNKLFVYIIKAKDQQEVEAAKDDQLKPPPAHIVPETEVAQSNWREREAAKYDRFMTLARVTFKYLDTCTSMGVGDFETPNGALIKDEKDLLNWSWKMIDSYHPMALMSGWEMSTMIYPFLVNRSIRNNVTTPDWARPLLSKRFPTLEMYDYANLYMCGASYYARKLPALHHALKYWLRRDFENEEAVKLLAEVTPQDDRIQDAACAYLTGLAEVDAVLHPAYIPEAVTT